MGLSVAAPLSSEPPLCCLEWPLGVRLGTCWRVAVRQALLSLRWRLAQSSSQAPSPAHSRVFLPSGLRYGRTHTRNSSFSRPHPTPRAAQLAASFASTKWPQL